jgi:neutral ceramidase
MHMLGGVGGVRFKVTLLSLVLALLLVAGVTVGVTTASADTSYGTGLAVGAGKAEISPPVSMFPIYGNKGAETGAFTAVLDPLYVKVLVVKNGSASMAFAVLDLTSENMATINSMKSAISTATGVQAENVFVTCTHNFSSPRDPNEPNNPDSYTSVILKATAQAAAAAASSLKPAKVGYGTGLCNVNVNRNVLTKDGYFLGTNEALLSNHSVGVTRFDDLSGKPLAVIINYDCQPAVLQDSQMSDKTCRISADLAGAATQHVEDQYGNGCIGFYMIGASADQWPAYKAAPYAIDRDGYWWHPYPDKSQLTHEDLSLNAGDSGPALLTAEGRRLGTEVVRVLETIKTVNQLGTPVRTLTDSVTVKTKVQEKHPAMPVKSAVWTPADPATKQAKIYIWQIGDAVFVGGLPELSTSTTVYIKMNSPFRYTFVGGMFDGGDYNMPDMWNYENFTYSSRDGTFWPGSAETWADQVRHDLNQMWQAK